jgi:anti-sigma factor RsiW
VERHLPDCPDCGPLYQNRRTLREVIRGSELYYAPPPGLEARLRKSIRQSSASPTVRPSLGRWGALAALVLGVLLTAGVIRALTAPLAAEPLAQEVLTSHLRSLMADHLSDVASSDQHTVKPWFDGKVDFSPVVVDTTSQGFPLVGGRLDYLDNRPVAALVYQRQRHVINLFSWPSSGTPDSSPQASTRQGYNLLQWTQAGMTYWAVSDVNTAELETFAHLIQTEAAATPAP